MPTIEPNADHAPLAAGLLHNQTDKSTAGPGRQAAVPLLDPQGQAAPGAIGFARHDATAARDRMAVIRTIASGLGHDLGNVLMPIRLSLDSLAKGELSARARADLESIRFFAEYLKNLSNGLRMLSRDPARPGEGGDRTDVAEWWREIDPLLRAMLPGQVEVVPCATDKPMIVAVARHRLTHAIFALLHCVTAGRDRLAAKVDLSAEHLADPPRVRLKMRDKNPPGELPISVGTVVRVQGASPCPEEPLSKQVLHHPWAGLAPETLAAVGGRIDVESQPNGGTTYSLCLPLGGAPAADPQPLGHPHSAVLRLPNTREGAYVRTLLEAMGVDVFDSTDVPPGLQPTMWITADPEEAMYATGQDGAAARARHVLYFGDGMSSAPEGVIVLGPRAEPATVREVLKNVTRGDPTVGAACP